RGEPDERTAFCSHYPCQYRPRRPEGPRCGRAGRLLPPCRRPRRTGARRRDDHAGRQGPAAAGPRRRPGRHAGRSALGRPVPYGFLLPSRADLGRFINHAIADGIRIEGASDHIVSEALYLTDPEGNGVEIYADRPHEGWAWNDGMVEMATARMDVPGVVGSIPAGDGGWRGAPENTVVGHVHLRVGNPNEAENFWHEAFGFDTVAKYGEQAVFLSSGGYHHHIAGNIWQSP